MKAVKSVMVMTAAWLAFLAGIAAAQLKYVAVVETGIDERSGVAAEITSAEIALVTAELRREAVNSLPQGKYSVMTSETVQSMGGAVLEECAEENCVITLGAKIGADYIVRGTISKFQTKFTLSVEMYETDNGTLVASSEPVRTQNLEELLDKAKAACGEMYRKFANMKAQAAPIQQTNAQTVTTERPTKSNKANVSRTDGASVSGKADKETDTHIRTGIPSAPGDTVPVSKEFVGFDENGKPVYRVKSRILVRYNYEGTPIYRTKKDYRADGDTASKIRIGRADNGHGIYVTKSSYSDSSKNALIIDATPLLSYPIIKIINEDNGILGFGLQYERKLDDKLGVVIKYTYFDWWHDKLLWDDGTYSDWSTHSHSFDICARYYPTGETLFLDGMLGYNFITNGNYYYSGKSLSNLYIILNGEPQPYDYFKGGVSLGWRIESEEISGFIWELSLGWAFAFNNNHNDGASIVTYALHGIRGGAGIRLAVTAFGWKF